jgi:hypothetical protein
MPPSGLLLLANVALWQGAIHVNPSEHHSPFNRMIADLLLTYSTREGITFRLSRYLNALNQHENYSKFSHD